ncbi:GNAT family N-acetyltransferase [Streptomyces minutiscleroticus]|uniref:GNAT family N-acetyltransferase n=1 Tax=Streptomyces minutiscleroticus TaxID=68238 RepID=UPI00332B47E7
MTPQRPSPWHPRSTYVVAKPRPTRARAFWTARCGPHRSASEAGRGPSAGGRGRIRPLDRTGTSAVRTVPDHRGRGLAARRIRAVATSTRARGGAPLPHAADGDARTMRPHESVGFPPRRRSPVRPVHGPGTPREAGTL